jgi:hypothetical protein
MIAQLLAAALGVWLMAAPAVLGYGGAAQSIDRIIGPLIACFGVVGAANVTRDLRWVLLPLGVALAIVPWLFSYDLIAAVNSVLVGALVGALSSVRGSVDKRFGGGWLALLPGRDLDEP